ncbi:Ribosomal protein [Parasponia andersonii]|uniref:Ribosomal protein n=1 Tax=Parasponia andersonii TaxID=3476 RepID=A0A2P5A7E1_PARAD|nr:Ribosomal protein [Parasponia andersonii]
MVRVVTAANLLKAGAGGGGGLLVLSSSAPSPSPSPWIPSRLRLLAFQNRNFHIASLKLGTFFFSRSSTRTSSRPRPRPRGITFCTANDDDAAASAAAAASVAAAPASSSSSSSIKDAADMLDIRVGRILKAWRHEEADSLYVEEVDVGESEPRIICSGLVKYIPLHQLQDTKVVVLANLKPRNMRGVKSFGMLLAASDASHEKVELLLPPQDSVPGERIWFGSQLQQQDQPPPPPPPPAAPNQIQKKKIWELVQPHLKTDYSCIATLGEYSMQTSAGVVLCTSLKNANIS